MSEPRKATDVLIELESKVNTLLDIVRAQDLTNKIISNKLNDIITRLEKQQQAVPKFTVEAVQNIPLPPTNLPPGFTSMPAGDPERNVPFLADSLIPQTNSPDGFRRNSRPETFAKKTDFPPYEEVKMPIQLPQQAPANRSGPGAMNPPPGRSNGSEVIVPPQATAPKTGRNIPPLPPQNEVQLKEQAMPTSAQGQVAVMQRCVDKNGKSIFLADVEITNTDTNQPYFKTRTNGTGKWMASMGIGNYRVVIRKRESVTKEKIEAVQDVSIDGRDARLDLPMLIIK